MYAVTVPILCAASRKMKLLIGRSVPLIGLFAALSFVIMMFNVPLPGGTTGHAVGSVLAAIVLGPSVASLAVSVALIIQALFFGDGGILALGTNIFNVAIVMPFVGFYLYGWLSGCATLTAPRRVLAGAVAGYVGINVAALLAAIELGIQPIFFHDATGHALYFPYGLGIAIPAMLLGHLAIAGPVEALVTGLVVAWMQRTNPQLLKLAGGDGQGGGRLSRWAWAGLLALIVLTPFGLLAPGTAWGEWGRAELKQLGLGYIPAGFDRWSSLWTAPFARYDVPVFHNSAAGYVLSALAGVVLILVVIYASAWIIGKLRRRHEDESAV
jgi:cobalt/nickel transport system permease protein